MATDYKVNEKTDWFKTLRKSSTFNILLILIVMIIAMLIISPPFRSVSNILSVIRLFVPIAVAGIGVCMVIITAGIDLSLGSVYGLAGVISSLALTSLGAPVLLAIILGVLSGTGIGFANSLLVEKIGLPPFIATLATMIIARGICYIVTQGYPISGLSPGYLFLGQGSIAGVPTQIWFMAGIAVIFSIFLNKTVTGRRIYALGGNEEATRISGINTSRIKILVYTLCGTLAGFAGIITASKLGIGQPTSGLGFELDAIAAVCIGGASLMGGAGTVMGTIIGASIMGILRNALVLLSVDAYWQQFIIGFVILFAVAADQISKKRGIKL